MGKQPAAGQKKTKDQIMKAAQSKKGGKKKWTKGKAKDKVQHAVFLEKKKVEDIINNPNKVGKVLTVSNLIEKHKVNGSVARGLLRMMDERKTAEFVTKNNNQWIYAALASGKGTVEGQEKKNEAKAKPEVKQKQEQKQKVVKK